MKKLLFLIFLHFFTATNAQQSKWAVSLGPTLIGLNAQPKLGIQAGVAYTLNHNLELLTEVGIALNQQLDAHIEHFKYCRLRSEIRYIFHIKENRPNPYVSFQGSYVFRSWKKMDSSYYFSDSNTSDSVIHFATANIHSPVFIFASNFGLTTNFGKHFGLDFFVGAGVRIVHTKYTNVTNAVKMNYQFVSKHYSYKSAFETNDVVTAFHVNLGIRFLYRF